MPPKKLMLVSALGLEMDSECLGAARVEARRGPAEARRVGEMSGEVAEEAGTGVLGRERRRWREREGLRRRAGGLRVL